MDVVGWKLDPRAVVIDKVLADAFPTRKIEHSPDAGSFWRFIVQGGIYPVVLDISSDIVSVTRPDQPTDILKYLTGAVDALRNSERNRRVVVQGNGIYIEPAKIV